VPSLRPKYQDSITLSRDRIADNYIAESRDSIANLKTVLYDIKTVFFKIVLQISQQYV
jgi:hypothetical protein